VRRLAVACGLVLLLGQPGLLASQPDLVTAEALAAAGNPKAAAELFRAILASPTTADTVKARALDGLGAAETALGEYAQAQRHSDEAAELFKRLGDSVRQAGALNRAGLARLYAGSYRDAGTAFAEAAALSKAAGNAEAEAEQITNLGNVHYFLGRYGDAAIAYHAALALAERHSDAPWASRRRRLALINTATLDQRLGRDRDALASYQRLAGEMETLRPREQAQLQANLGVLYRRLGDPIKALETYDRALELFAKDPLLDGELGVLKNRGIVSALDLGDLSGAVKTFSDAQVRAHRAGNRRELLQAQLYRAEAFRRQGELGRAREDFTASVALARELQTPEETWKSLYGLGLVELGEDSRASAGRHFEDALSVIESIRESIRVPALRSDFFADKREVYDSLMAMEIGRASPEWFLTMLERSHSRAWRERLGLPAQVTLADVQRRLPTGTVLLNYWHSTAGSAVVAVRADRATVTPLPVTPKQIVSLSDSLAAGPSAGWAEAAAALSAAVLPPAAIEGATHVIVVTDGALALVPFEVLGVGGAALIDRASVSYLPTAALLLAPRPEIGGLSWPWRRTVTAFADPIAGNAALDDPSLIRTRLGASAAEARDIAAEIGGTATIHSGAENRKAFLVSPADPAPILHLSTHASADGDALERSRIMFSSGPGGSAEYLFLREAYELPLTGVELAVLSACDTARGRLVRGEGVQSFSRAFLAAGAQTTVTTLWRVADGPTADFMRVFYDQLGRGVGRAEALRQAKLRFKTSEGALADPHYWAAFVLSGEGAQPVPRALRWRTILGATLVLTLALLWLVRSHRRRRGELRPPPEFAT
jgi:tetratricopeptide (TPR) repeat protein